MFCYCIEVILPLVGYLSLRTKGDRVLLLHRGDAAISLSCFIVDDGRSMMGDHVLLVHRGDAAFGG